MMQDAPGKKWDGRKIEVISSGVSPAEVVSGIKEAKLGWHFLCHIHDDAEDFDQIRAEFKALGYRAVSTEGFFAHDLKAIPEYQSNPPARLLSDPAEFKMVNQVTTQPRKLETNSDLIGVWDEARDYGWVRNYPVENNAWVSALHVFQDYRGRGYGRALMAELLRLAKSQGQDYSVLLASADGARLYPHLGYQRIGTLQMFCPANKRAYLSNV